MSAHAQILIGQTVGITGMVAANASEMIGGAQLVIDAVNAGGGVHGEQIEVVRMDDAFDVRRAGENTRVLIEDKKVLALFMTRGTPHSQAAIPWLDKHGVPLIGPASGAMILSRPTQRHVFNVRSSYQREAEKGVQHLLTIGLTRIVVVTVNDSFGVDALEGATIGFAKGGAKPAAVITADRDKPDYAAIVSAVKAADAQAVLWFAAGMAVVDGIKALRSAGSSAQVVTLSNNASSGFIKNLGTSSAGVIVTQVFPNERSIGHPLVREALALARTKGQTEISPTALEGFASAKVLVEALRRAGPKPTRARLLTALENLRGFDLGGGLVLNYSPQDHSGVDFTDLSIISEGRFKR